MVEEIWKQHEVNLRSRKCNKSYI